MIENDDNPLNAQSSSSSVARDDDPVAMKPIKKKDLIDDEYEEYDQLQISGSNSSHPVDMATYEQKAKAELISFLSNKGVDLKAADDYNIHLRRVKSKKGRESSSNSHGFSVTYSSPDGSILTSKTDVLNAIMHNASKKTKNGNISNDISKVEAYHQAVERFKSTLPILPAQLGDIRLIDLGKINTSSSFHNSVQIYPVGYKCEQVVNTNSATRGSRQSTLWCEIVDVAGDPEFLITVKSTGQTYLAPTEAEVWRKFDPTNIDLNWSPSFFNLEIELLIEGLENSKDCENYKFHAERGYGTTYFSHEQSITAKKSFLLKSSREKRNKSRQSTKQGDDLIYNEGDRRSSHETGKDRSLKEKEETLKRKAEARERIKLQKEDQRKAELAVRERQKQEEKEIRDRLRAEDKAKQQVRKDVRTEVKRSQADAAQLVLEYFDAEEDFAEQGVGNEKGLSNASSEINSSDVNSLLQSAKDYFNESPSFNNSDICSAMIEVANCLYVFRGYLKLHFVPTLEELKSNIVSTSDAISEVYSSVRTDNKMEQPSENTVEDNDEAEWDDSNRLTSDNTKRNSFTDDESLSKSELMFDRVHLCLVAALREPLLESLDINESTTNENAVKRSEKSSRVLSLPLNQLTWHELARMCLISFIFTELGRSKEDIQGAVRGGKHTNLKATSKSVIKYIRYKFATRSLKSEVLKTQNVDASEARSNDYMQIAVGDLKPLENDNEDLLLTRLGYDVGQKQLLLPNSPLSNIFNTEDEIVANMTNLSLSEYSESYQRCCKVFLKIFGTAQARNLIWEVDREAYPDYYATIKKPMSFVNVATSLLNKGYGESESSSIDMSICNSFYRDMRQVLLNCSTYNTESTYIFIQAQKLLHVLFRHMQRWIWSPTCPGTPSCDEQHCIWSYEYIQNSNLKSIRCDRCSGVFSLGHLFREDVETKISDEDQKLYDILIEPTQEQIDQTHEEWYCPFCLMEDSVETTGQQQFYMNEWGTSALIPWLLNANHSTVPETISSEMQYLQPAWNALQILSNPLLLPSLRENSMERWSIEQRIQVLCGLCRILYSDIRGIDFLHRMAADCEKLLRISCKASFREADFLNVVKDILGEKDVSLCRSFLDGIDNREKDLFNRVITGRCVICKGSTYEEDIGEDVPVILCDGCNAEVHLSCLNLTHVPSHAWHCPTCAERMALRETKTDNTLANVDDYRNKEIEEDMMNRLVDIKALSNEEAERNHESNSKRQNGICVYCGLTEMDLCSPFVVGQSREEHDIYAKSFQAPTASNFYPNKSNTSVLFVVDGVVQEPPKLTVPYFPLCESDEGDSLVKEMKLLRKEPVIVHELCALNMFQARLDRSRHILRRRRKLIGDQVIALSGLSTIALGIDSSSRTYWKFPTSEDLFICEDVHPIPEKDQFNKLLGLKKNRPTAKSSQGGWKVISDTTLIRNLVLNLNASRNASDRSLGQNIINSILMKRELQVVAPLDTNADQTAKFATDDKNVSETNPESESDGNEGNKDSSTKESRRESSRNIAAADSIPVALKLIKDKGQEVFPVYEIAEEAVFEDVNALDDEDDDDISHGEYFSYSRNKYFAIAIVNNQDKKLKFAKGAVTVTYQVHREGLSHTLAYTPLNEQWSDNIYYFSTVNFKRSGNYTLSFIIEGADFASKIEPLVFPVTVKALYTLRGLKHALSQLNASKYVFGSGRQIVTSRRELTNLASKYLNDTPENDFEATRTALYMLYAALPAGSLNYDATSTESTTRVFEMVANSSGWNDYLDQVWRSAVNKAESPETLMECLILLEYFINKSWLASPHHRLINALALPHFAIKCATASSIALRIYCIDRAMMYDKVLNLPRQTRRGGSTNEDAPPQPTIQRSVSRSSRTIDSDNNKSVEDETRFGRTRRQASSEASSRIKSITKSEEIVSSGKKRKATQRDEEETYRSNSDENDEGENSADDYGDSRKKSATSQQWKCVHCSTNNELRARSCSGCGERKVPSAISVEIPNPSRPSRLRQGARRTYKDEDEAEFDENEDNDYDTSKKRKSSFKHDRKQTTKRKRSRRSDSDDDEEDDEVDDVDDGEEDEQQDNEEDEEVDNTQNQGEIDFDQDIEDQRNSNSDSAETNIKFIEILRDLYNDPRSAPFWEPVDLKAVPLYRKLIARPMDLGTVLNDIRIDYYSGDRDAIAKDIRLVWENCMTFNMDDSPLFRCAKELYDTFENLYEEAFS